MTITMTMTIKNVTHESNKRSFCLICSFFLERLKKKKHVKKIEPKKKFFERKNVV